MKDKLHLLYINKIGTNFKGEHMFEFLFSDKTDWDWDESWYESSVITDKNDLTPEPNFIKLVGNLKTEELDLEFIKRLNSNLIPIELGPNNWVDERVFDDLKLEKKYDCVMVAMW